jgi:uncharacterized protein (TIGR03000 family)
VVSLLLATPLGVARAAPNSADPSADAKPAVITLRVPAGALVQFDGVQTEQSGITRHFETPPLTPGRKYSYDMSVSWTDGGQTVVRKRRVSFQAGEHITLSFGPSFLLGGAGDSRTNDLLTDPAAPDPSGTAYEQNPLNWPTYPLDLRQLGSGSSSPTAVAAHAGIRILVPADAEVFIDGEPTTQKGSERLFMSPPLQAGKKYHYDILARWKDNGKPVERTRKVVVSGGVTVRVDLRTPLPDKKAKGSPKKPSS